MVSTQKFQITQWKLRETRQCVEVASSSFQLGRKSHTLNTRIDADRRTCGDVILHVWLSCGAM